MWDYILQHLPLNLCILEEGRLTLPYVVSCVQPCKHTKWTSKTPNPCFHYKKARVYLKTALGNSHSQPEIKTWWTRSGLISISSLISRVGGFRGVLLLFPEYFQREWHKFQNLLSFRKGNHFYVCSFPMKKGGFTQILIAVTTWRSKLTSDYVKKH